MRVPGVVADGLAGGGQLIWAEAGSTVYAVLRGDIHIRNGHPVYVVMPFPLEARAVAGEQAWQQPSRLLAADAAVVPFAGRSRELAELAAWRDDPQPGVSVMLVYAPGGQGKTRLAARFAADSAAGGWMAWAARHLSDPAGQHVVALGDPGRSLVLVADYADRWPVDDLNLLLENPLLRRPERCRVLLVARQAGTWWPSVCHRLGKSGVSIGPTMALPALTGAVPERREAFTSARDAFGAVLGVPAVGIDIPGGLEDDAFGLVLTLHMAALVAVDAHQRGADPPADPVGLSAYLLDREHDFWHALHDHQQISTAPPVMGRAVYTATLTHALHRDQAAAVLARARVVDAGTAPAVLADHARCYPPPAPEADSTLEPLYPDRLGEDFLALTTPGHAHPDYSSDEWALQAPARLLAPHMAAFPPYARPTLTALVETARRWPHLASQQLYPLLSEHPQLALAVGGTTLAGIAERPDISISLLEAIEKCLPPDRHTDLDAGIAVLAQRLARHRLTITTDPAARARIQANLGIRLVYAGLHAEAAALVSEAERTLRELARTDPATYEPQLARALHNLAITLAGVGEHREALVVAREAAFIRRRHADESRDFDPELADSLISLGVQLSRLGQYEEAAAVSREAASMCRRLAEDAPETYEVKLATAASNLGIYLFQQGLHAEALAAAEEAVSIRRHLAESRPAAHEPDLAASLDVLSVTMSALGRDRDAAAAVGEAAQILRRLAKINPAVFEPGLGSALTNLGIVLARLGSQEEAVAAGSEAVEILRTLARDSPGVREPILAMALTNLSVALAAAGQRQQARTIGEEAVNILRRLARANPGAWEPHLAAALNNLSGEVAAGKRPKEALPLAQEAAGLYRRMASEQPAAYRAGLASSLTNLGISLAALRQSAQALAAARESVQTYRDLDRVNQGLEADYATALHNLGLRLAEAGMPAESVAPLSEALGIRRQLAETRPAAYERAAGRTANNLTQALLKLGRYREAAATGEQAVASWKRLTDRDPGVHEPGLVSALANVSDARLELELYREALATAEEAVAIGLQIHKAATTPSILPVLARAMALAAATRIRGNLDPGRALTSIRASVALYRQLAQIMPGSFTEDLRSALYTGVSALKASGRSGEASALQEIIASNELMTAARRLQEIKPEKPAMQHSKGNGITRWMRNRLPNRLLVFQPSSQHWPVMARTVSA